MQMNPMLYLKQCPRCKGDMHMNRDIYGTYKECLQCGHMIDLDVAKTSTNSDYIKAEVSECAA